MWRDDLPRIQRENKEWSAKFGPILSARTEQQARRRADAIRLVNEGLNAIDATAEQRRAVADAFMITVVGAAAEDQWIDEGRVA